MSTVKKLRRVVVGVLLMATMSACGNDSELPDSSSSTEASLSHATTPSTPLIRAALQKCDKPSYPVADRGKTLVIETGQYTQSAANRFAMFELDCIFSELDMPSSVESHIGATRALDGMQTAEWGEGWFARWTYHPDAGLNMTIEDRH